MTTISEFHKGLVSSRQFERLWRVSIGPRSAGTLGKLFSVGAPVSLPDSSALLTAPFDISTSDKLSLSGTFALEESGTLIIAPYGETASVVSYEGKNDLSGEIYNTRLVRGGGQHESGTAVVAWLDISRYVTSNPTITETEESNVYDWSATISGVNFDPKIMIPDCAILIEQMFIDQERTNSDWVCAAMGYANEWEARGGRDTSYGWTCRVVSTRYYLNKRNIKARRYGAIPISASVTASGTLASAFLEPREFLLGVGDVDPNNVMDGDPNSAWISDKGLD